MIEKLVNFILFLVFCCLNYFLYLKIDVYRIDSLFENKLILFFILIIFLNIILLNCFFIFKIQNKKTILLKKISDYEDKMSKIHEEYKNKFELLANKNNIKDKIIFEQSKQNSMRDLLSNISHHWRQPLSVISLLASSMQMYKKEDLELDEIIKKGEAINNNVQYLSNIIESFSKKIINKEKKEMFRIDSVLEEVSIAYHLSPIDIRFDIKQTLSLYTYKDELLKVLFYIMKNSKEKFIKREIENKIIFIEVSGNDNELTIKIKDNAGGIEEEILDRVFEPYITTKFKSKNVGLGLYLTYMIVNQELKGKIEVENITFFDEKTNKKYKGVEFSLTIPRM